MQTYFLLMQACFRLMQTCFRPMQTCFLLMQACFRPMRTCFLPIQACFLTIPVYNFAFIVVKPITVFKTKGPDLRIRSSPFSEKLIHAFIYFRLCTIWLLVQQLKLRYKLSVHPSSQQNHPKLMEYSNQSSQKLLQLQYRLYIHQ